jgi:uncharacterized protein involved in exopolysaccharide biosynthesis
MALGAQTPRDQLDRLLALVKRSVRYLWVTALVTVLGALLSVAFALTRSRVYESSTVIMHRDIIPTRLLQGGDSGSGTRNMGLRFHEMILARPLLAQVIEELKLYPELVEAHGTDRVVEKMRAQIHFDSRGGGTFTVGYRGESAEIAQQVAARAADLLIEWEKRIQLESVGLTKDFLAQERQRAQDELEEKEKALAQFLATHPEFAQEAVGSQAGASIRARQGRPPTGATRDPRLRALERQRERIQARLEARPERVVSDRPTTPEQISAARDVDAARRELDQAQRSLEDKQGLFTDAHPDVAGAKREVASAEARLNRAEVALARAMGAQPPEQKPVSAEERQALAAELADLDDEIAAARRKTSGSKERESATNWVVELETEWARLYREVNEMRERYAEIETKAFTADIVAASEIARQGNQLTVVDPAFLPTRPTGTPRSLIVMAGTFVFGCLGAVIALGLALVDDRIVGRYDVERLEIVPVLVEVPKGKAKGRFRRA